MILQFERWNQVLPTPVPRVKNSGPRMRNTIWHRGDATGSLEEEPVLAPDAASGLSGFSGDQIGWRACSSDLTVLKSWSWVSSAAFVFFYHLSSHSGLARALV